MCKYTDCMSCDIGIQSLIMYVLDHLLSWQAQYRGITSLYDCLILALMEQQLREVSFPH